MIAPERAPERPPHTSLLEERRQIDEANQCMGMIRKPWWWTEANGEFVGFLMTTESQDFGLTLSKGQDLSHLNQIAIWLVSSVNICKVVNKYNFIFKK